MPPRSSTAALAIATVTGLIAFALIACCVLGLVSAYPALAGGLVFIGATAGLTLYGTRPSAR
jgi:hypothetical protein